MRLLCALVTHDRWAYTERCLRSWLNTRHPEDRLVVFDNASTDETPARLRDLGEPAVKVMLCDRNLFPGAATNRAWFHGMKEWGSFDLLQRSDNDIEYLDGWRDHVEDAFAVFPELVQLGVLNRSEDYGGDPPVAPLEKNGYTVNVHWDQFGGNTVMRRTMWDQGVRWQPGRWMPGGTDEDSIMAAVLRERGLVAGIVPTVARNMSFHRYHDYPAYYNQTAALRGLVPELSV